MARDFNRYNPVSISGTVRGLTGMVSYYTLIGILLGIFALCVGGPLLILRMYDRNEGKSRAGAHYQANENTPHWLRPYVGNFDRHGQILDISPDGHGTYRSRTYTLCSENPQPPCEREPGDMPLQAEFTVEQVGGSVVARTNDGDRPMRLIKPGIVEYDGDTFCDSEVVDRNDPAIQDCGA